MQSNSSKDHSIVLFDGICNYCNSWVNFTIRHDKRDMFRFAPLQSDAGRAILEKFGLDSEKIDTFVLVEGEQIYLRSTAGLRMLKGIGGFYAALYSLIIVPPYLRDWVYRIIARNRYRWWGKKETCMVPTPELKKKFL